jgi:TonB family protein
MAELDNLHYNSPLHMNRTFSGALILLLASVGVSAEDAAAPSEQALAEAARMVDIRAAGEKPFRLELDFRAQLKVPWEGHLTFDWAARDLWSRKVTMNAYQQVDVRKGDTLYTKRNAPFTPLALNDLFDLLSVFHNAPDEWRVNRSRRAGDDVDCLSLRQSARLPGPWRTGRELCLHRTLKDVLSDQEKNDVELRRKEFSDYREFRAHRYPQQLKLTVNGSVVLNARVNSLTGVNIDPATLTPPTFATEHRQCDDVHYPEPTYTPDPAYPRSAVRSGSGGTVQIALTLQTNGSVGRLNVLQSAGQEKDTAAVDKVMTWKFKPAMCGNEPIPFDIRVAMNFTGRAITPGCGFSWIDSCSSGSRSRSPRVSTRIFMR